MFPVRDCGPDARPLEMLRTWLQPMVKATGNNILELAEVHQGTGDDYKMITPLRLIGLLPKNRPN